jgi:ribosome-associated heat shock protein Hsp15
VRIGATIYIKRKEVDIEVVVMALSSIRRSAPEAQQLYQETQQSQEKREQAKISRIADHAKRERGAGRPTKRQIRDIRKFTGMDYF